MHADGGLQPQPQPRHVGLGDWGIADGDGDGDGDVDGGWDSPPLGDERGRGLGGLAFVHSPLLGCPLSTQPDLQADSHSDLHHPPAPAPAPAVLVSAWGVSMSGV